jgi:hypothetical protein
MRLAPLSCLGGCWGGCVGARSGVDRAWRWGLTAGVDLGGWWQPRLCDRETGDRPAVRADQPWQAIKFP